MTNQAKSSSSQSSVFTIIAIFGTILVCYLLYFFLLGHEGNFENNDPKKGHALNLMGIIYKGGWLVVPILMSCLLMVFIFSIERTITIISAYGAGSVNAFVRKIKVKLLENDINGAIDECDLQKGSVGNVVYAALHKYKQMWNDRTLNKEQKVLGIQKELEEATALELPMLEKNLTVLATLASVSTLFGLLGTVFGMITAFSALATAGTPDPVTLANGISEALINTAFGILASAIAIIAYNIFTSKIDSLTYSIDEVGFTISQNFSTNYKEGVKETASVL